jgi:hypothetical protein
METKSITYKLTITIPKKTEKTDDSKKIEKVV